MKQIKKRVWLLLLCLVFMFQMPAMAKETGEKKAKETPAQSVEHSIAGKSTTAATGELSKSYRMAGMPKAAVNSDSYFLTQVQPKDNSVIKKGEKMYVKFCARDTWRSYYTKPLLAIFDSRDEIVYSNFDMDVVSLSGQDVYSGYLGWNTGKAAAGKYTLYIVGAPCYRDGEVVDDWSEFDCPYILTDFTLKASGTSHQHTYGAWRTVKPATALETGKRQRVCTSCGQTQTQTIAKLTPTVKLSVTQKKLAPNKSYVLKISGLARGDSVKSVTAGRTTIATVKKVKANQYRITGRKKGATMVTVVLKSGKKATCKVTVQ